MASKKYILVMALIVLLQSVGIAQTDWGWDWKDTSKISVKNLPQHNEFLNNQYPYLRSLAASGNWVFQLVTPRSLVKLLTMVSDMVLA
jgi:hypothetical protein